MIQRLEENEYERIRPLFDGLRYNLVIDSVIDGNTRAWVYADDVSCPRSAFMWNRQDAMLLAGDADNDEFNRALDRLITEEIIPDARERYIPHLSLHYFPQAWESKAGVILRDKHPVKARRRFYTLADLKVDWKAGLRPGYTMQRMDDKLLARTDLKNVDQVLGWILSFWHSTQDFTRTGFGFCLIQGETILSWCLSVFASENEFELGLATDAAYRKQGLATLTASACIDHCTTHQLTPLWHCWDGNLPSIAVAEKVGFEKTLEYTVYRFELGA
jgi:RimJ/RimL family protein N-acetyltransferase